MLPSPDQREDPRARHRGDTPRHEKKAEEEACAASLGKEKAWVVRALTGLPLNLDKHMSYNSFDTSSSDDNEICLKCHLRPLLFHDKDNKGKGGHR